MVFQQMVADLWSMFPGMSIEYAEALTWGGLEETTVYMAMSAADQQTQRSRARDYRYGAKGEACP